MLQKLGLCGPRVLGRSSARGPHKSLPAPPERAATQKPTNKGQSQAQRMGAMGGQRRFQGNPSKAPGVTWSIVPAPALSCFGDASGTMSAILSSSAIDFSLNGTAGQDAETRAIYGEFVRGRLNRFCLASCLEIFCHKFQTVVTWTAKHLFPSLSVVMATFQPIKKHSAAACF